MADLKTTGDGLATPTGPHAYYIHHPRDFANEYTVYVVAFGLESRFLAVMPDGVRRIGRAAALRRGWGRPREAKRDREEWYGGFAETGLRYNDTLTEAIADARKATTQEVEHREMMREVAHVAR